MKYVYVAVKFAPSRCPACERRFDTQQSFALWAGNQGGTFVEAQSSQPRLYPELYQPVDEPGVALAWDNPQQADFICCARCGNKTLRITMDQRTFATREDAERLVVAAQYSYVVECEIPPGQTLEDGQQAGRSMREQRAP